MKKRNLILLLYYVMIGMSALSVSFTIAWYASSTNLRVDTILIQLDTERDLRISTSPEYDTFVDTLHPNDVKQVGIYTPVSTNFKNEWINEEEVNKPSFYDLSYYLTNISGVPYLKEATYGYFNQDIYLMCDDNVYVGLSAEETYVQPNLAKNREYASILAGRNEDESNRTEDEYYVLLNEIAKSTRMAFLMDGEFTVIDPSDSGEVIFGGVLDNTNDRYYDYYQSQVDGHLYEVFYGECEDRSKLVYDEMLVEDSEPLPLYNAFNARHKAGVHPLNIEKSIENGAKIAYEDKTELKELMDDQFVDFPSFCFELKAYTPKKINLSFFLEGWDIDSVNSSAGGSFDVNISFRIIREMGWPNRGDRTETE